MPAYGTLPLPSALYPGDSYLCFNNENPASATLSERVALGQKDPGNPNNVSVEATFVSAPGAFELDLMTADTDTANDFQPCPALAPIIAVGSNNVVRGEAVGVLANFAAIYCRTSAGVACTVKLTSH